MATFGQGYYSGQQGPPPPGFYPQGAPPYPQQGYPQPGYPAQAPPYPSYPSYPASPPQPAMPGYHSGYGEDPLPSNDQFAFSDKTIRMGFIRKVYGILMCQLTVTLGFVCAVAFSEGTRKFVLFDPVGKNLWWVALVVMFVTLITMVCCGDVRRKAPMNFIFLGLFTLAESFLLGVTTARFESLEVVLAIGITAVMVLGLTIFAFQTKIDFTAMGGALLCLMLALMIFGFGLMIFGTNKWVTLAYASFGALLFAVYIVYDTQLMIGGNNKYSISPEEYIFAVLNLYLDIINLFLYILTIIGAARD